MTGRDGETGGAVGLLARGGDMLADLVGHVATLALLALTAGLVLGIALRWVGIDNSWTYDLDVFALVWTAFAGAALTARLDRHVTAGIALERMFIGRTRRVLRLVRTAIVVGFLALLTLSGWWDASSAYATHETTIDVDQWPMWVARAALPVGVGFWALAEFCKALLGRGGQ